MATAKAQDQKTGLVFQANVMVLQETRRDAVTALDTIEKAIVSKEFQKLSAEQRSALRDIRGMLVDLKPKA
jgi:hypothetical protein